MGAARALRRGLSPLSLLAAREGGACPGPELPCALRRGHRYQLFACLLLQVRAGVEEGLGYPAASGSGALRPGVHGGQVAK